MENTKIIKGKRVYSAPYICKGVRGFQKKPIPGHSCRKAIYKLKRV